MPAVRWSFMPILVRRTALPLLFLTAAWLTVTAVLPAQQPAPAPQLRVPTELAPGVRYEHLQQEAPAGEPWSIHVLRVARDAKGVRIAAVSGATPEGRMTRNLPTQIARTAASDREQVLAAVNGDYDMAAPYLGVSDGLSVTSGRLWTTGKPAWPALALLASGEPVIAVPEVSIDLRAGRRRVAIGGLNKPLGSGHGSHPRAYTHEYATHLRSAQPFRAVVIGRLSPALPLRVDRTVRGVVLDTAAGVKELAIPAGAVVVAEWVSDSALGSAAAGAGLKRGGKVSLDFRVRMAGRKHVREAIGGFPVLVRDGRRTIEGDPSAYLSLRHPRTAACYNPRELIFVVVDGRQPKLSLGMTLTELADLMLSLGCTVAINTDGGGSSVMAIAPPASGATTPASKDVIPSEARNLHFQNTSSSNLHIVNSPSDGSERGRGNAWVILKKK
jgi:hypothetical protein